MKEPRLPKELCLNKRKLTDEQIELAKELIETNSERWVANYFGVSRNAIIPYIKPERMRSKELKKQDNNNWHINNKERALELRRESSKRTTKIKNKLFPYEMKEARKKNRLEVMGRDYFNKYMREYNKKIKLSPTP